MYLYMRLFELSGRSVHSWEWHPTKASDDRRLVHRELVRCEFGGQVARLPFVRGILVDLACL